MEGISVHPTTVQLSQSFPSDVAVGTDIILKIQVSCPEKCDLSGRPVSVVATNGIVRTSELVALDDRVNETGDVTIKAPNDVGEYTWTIVFPRHEADGCVHEESSSPISFRTMPHMASIAVWDVPSPVVMNSAFTVKVGIKCSVGCQLTGHLVEIADDAGTKVGEGRLAETPWPGTESLYWTAVDLRAPASEGVIFWNPGFVVEKPALAHQAAPARFSCRTAKPPEHTVTIDVTARNTGLPVDDVEVRVGAYEGFTDHRGVATIELPGGTYDLSIRREGYRAQPLTLEVSGDVTVSIEALDAPTKALTEEPVGPEHPYRD
jgi:hypothetical protein